MPLTRSQNMSRIRPTDTKPEVRLRKALWKDGLRYRLHYKIHKTTPDITFIKARLAVFIDGCQWHGCPEHYVRPRTREDFWSEKLLKNVERDIRQTEELESEGWFVHRIWEHEVWENLPKVVFDIKYILDIKSSPVISSDWRVYTVIVVDKTTDLERRYMKSLKTPENTWFVERQRSTRKWNRSTQ